MEKVLVFYLSMKSSNLECQQNKIMNNILVLAAAVVAVVSGSSLQSCSDEMIVLSQCLSDNGLSVSDFQNTQGNSSDLQTILKHCSKIPNYLKAIQCVTSEFTRCPSPNVHVPSVEQVIDSNGLLCNDSNLKFDCISQVLQPSAEMQSCVASQYGNNSTTPSIEDFVCEGAKEDTKCVVDLVTKCDAHTGSVVAKMAQASVSSICGGTTPS